MIVKAALDLRDERQNIDGFGVCGAFRQAENLYKYPEEMSERVLDLLFSREKGAGFSMVRSIIGDSGEWGTELDGPSASIEPADGLFDFTGDTDQIWMMREARKRGCEMFTSAVWSPPAWMKTSGSVCNGGRLRSDMYGRFADYLVGYIKGYKEVHGIDIYALSCANEPEFAPSYSSCLWKGAEMARFYREYLGPALRREGLDVQIYGPETEYFGMEALEEYKEIFRNEYGLPHIAAQHGYGGRIEPLDAAVLSGRKVWLSEISDTSERENDPSIHDGLFWAERVHDYLTVAGVSAFMYFWGASVYSRKGIALIGMNVDARSVIINKKLFTIGNYSRFIRPGFTRIGINMDAGEALRLSAFKGPDRELILVALNSGKEDAEITLDCMGFACPRFAAYRTSDTEDLQYIGTLEPGKGLSAIARSVTTFVGPAGE